MKILLENKPKDTTGFDLVVDPTGSTGEPLTPLTALERISPNQATDIVFNLLDTLHISEVKQVIFSYISKLRYNGEITFTCINAHEINRQFFLDNLDIEQYNVALYGKTHLDIDMIRSSYTISFIKTILEEAGLNIQLVRTNEDYTFTIKAKRAKPEN